jgi:hypothetical protein
MDFTEMDNVNVIRVGFFAPQTVLTDTDMKAEDPVHHTPDTYTCLVFVNPDEQGIGIIKSLEQGLARNESGIDWHLALVVPLKPKQAQEFKLKQKLISRVYCDGELKAGKSYSIVDSQSDSPAYHPTIFIVGDEGSVRQRFNIEDEDFSLEKFRNSIAAII